MLNLLCDAKSNCISSQIDSITKHFLLIFDKPNKCLHIYLFISQPSEILNSCLQLSNTPSLSYVAKSSHSVNTNLILPHLHLLSPEYCQYISVKLALAKYFVFLFTACSLLPSNCFPIFVFIPFCHNFCTTNKTMANNDRWIVLL